MSVASDAFGRTIALGSGWGTADAGGAWVCYTGVSVSNAKFGVNGSAGQVACDVAGSGRRANLPITVADVEVLSRFQLAPTPSGGTIVFFAAARGVDVQNAYRARVAQSPGGTLTVNIEKLVANVSTPLTSDTLWPGITNASMFYWIRFQVFGTPTPTLRMRIWQDGNAEPGTWDVSLTDGTYPSAGLVGLHNIASVGNTSLPTVLWDDLAVTDLGAGSGVLVASWPSVRFTG